MLVLATISLLLAGPLQPSSIVKAFAAACDLRLDREIESWEVKAKIYEGELAKMKVGKISGRDMRDSRGNWSFATNESKDNRVFRQEVMHGVAKGRLERLKSRVEILLPSLPAKMKPGDIGTLAVDQSVKSVLCVRVESDSSFVGKLNDKLVLVRGISTKGAVVNDSVDLPSSLVEVTGIHDHTDDSGAKTTVFVIEPFDLEAVKRCLRK